MVLSPHNKMFAEEYADQDDMILRKNVDFLIC